MFFFPYVQNSPTLEFECGHSSLELLKRLSEKYSLAFFKYSAAGCAPKFRGQS